ncbi:hypothetical protein CEXT_357041 [Caerostris extrusa]|uniref:Uncharacterized protein n=1 Tax=Caerostris extrusa TaxID=172846 RepID=A0AAV4W995_CAEEX|nr:hypothetical protein CEXT_357041 [Caerostris extrusa]
MENLQCGSPNGKMVILLMVNGNSSSGWINGKRFPGLAEQLRLMRSQYKVEIEFFLPTFQQALTNGSSFTGCHGETAELCIHSTGGLQLRHNELSNRDEHRLVPKMVHLFNH